MAKLPIIPTTIYEVQLKSVAEPVKFRAFTVKEEKILLTAAHGITGERLTGKQKKAMMDAMAQICHNCTFGEIDVHQLPVFDLNMLFTRLKQYSSGNGQKIKIPCANDECKKETVIEIDYDKFFYDVHEDHSTTIELVDGISVIMKYPSFKMAAAYEGKENEPHTVYAMTLQCMDMIVVGEEATPASHYSTAELEEFLDSLATTLRMKLTSFFDSMPKVVYQLDYKCPYCGHQNTFKVDDIEDFFV